MNLDRLQVQLVDSFQHFIEGTCDRFDKIISLEGLVEFSNSPSDSQMILQKCQDMLTPEGKLFFQLVCQKTLPVPPQQEPTNESLPFGTISINCPPPNWSTIQINKFLQFLDRTLTKYAVSPYETDQRHNTYLGKHLVKKTLQHQTPPLQSILQVFSDRDEVKAEYIPTNDCIETVKSWSSNFHQASQLLSNKEESKMWALQLALTQALLEKEVLVVLQLTYQKQK